ncbi:MAG: DUF2203 family protein [Thermoplasmata archaeon]|jgi:hypothetical protein
MPSQTPEHGRPPRLWTAGEANRRLADLSELLPRLRGWVVRLGEVHSELKRLGDFWGEDVDAVDHVDHELKSRLDAEWGHLTRRLEEAVNGLREEGVEVKELEQGTVDFYGTLGGEVVFLCWQRGESEVAFYHPVSGSFRDRRPLPEETRSPSAARPRGSA